MAALFHTGDFAAAVPAFLELKAIDKFGRRDVPAYLMLGYYVLGDDGKAREMQREILAVPDYPYAKEAKELGKVLKR